MKHKFASNTKKFVKRNGGEEMKTCQKKKFGPTMEIERESMPKAERGTGGTYGPQTQREKKHRVDARPCMEKTRTRKTRESKIVH